MIIFLFMLLACAKSNVLETTKKNDTTSFRKLDLDKELLEMVDNEGNTALHYAVKNRNLEMIIKLVEKHDKLLDIANGLGRTVIDFAVENKWLVELLITIGKSALRSNNSSFLRKKHTLHDGKEITIAELARKHKLNS